ncbi:ATP-dependent nuclease, partial [Luteimonas panaciterrae]|uniref:ATP-dependent nuclease n=1 Tax=Luteimonas panaciterrae TaxID=363885 RepID=UPI001CFB47FE
MGQTPANVNNFDSAAAVHSAAAAYFLDRDESISATVSHNEVGLPLDAAGTGFLQAVQILAYAAKDAPPLLLLDEPDAHLHPDRQRQLVCLLSELAGEGNFQVIIATHSRHVIDALDEDAAIHWVTGGELHSPEDTDVISVLTELGALDKGDQLRGGAIDAVVLTEDKHSKVLVPLLVSAGFDEERTRPTLRAVATEWTSVADFGFVSRG